MEQRLDLLEQLTNVPHGELGNLVTYYRGVFDRDPVLMQHYTAWLATNAKINDHKRAAVVAGVNYQYPENDYVQQAVRNAGLGVWNTLPFMDLYYVAAWLRENEKWPRSFDSELHAWLDRLESNYNTWDALTVGHRKQMRQLYIWLHRNEMWVQKALFDNDPPPNTKLWALKQVGASADPGERARLVVQYRLPYLIVTGALGQTPAEWLARLHVMSPQQIANQLRNIEKQGLLENETIADLINKKVKGSKRKVNVGRARAARQVTNEKVANLLTEIAEDAVVDTITRPTAFVVDISSSMERAIELARRLVPILVRAASDVRIYAFNDSARRIGPNDSASMRNLSLKEIEREFAMLRAYGMTAMGAPIYAMAEDRFTPEQVVYVTDEEGNGRGQFDVRVALRALAQSSQPDIISVYLGRRGRRLQDAAEGAGLPYVRITPTGDQYEESQILQVLAGKSQQEIAAEKAAAKLAMRQQFLTDVLGTPIPPRLVRVNN